MNSAQYETVEALIRCRMAPGSPDKAFIKKLHSAGPSFILSDKQAAYLSGLAARHKKQIAQIFAKRGSIIPQNRP